MTQVVETQKDGWKLTGWHALAIFVGAFAVIISVNIALAVFAVKSFPGLETRNAYLDSQTFDARRDAQLGLGWTVSARAEPGRVVLEMRDRTGQPVQPESIFALIGRPTHVQDDREAEFVFDGSVWVAQADLAPGNWNIRLRALAADGTPFNQRVVFRVAE